MNTAQKTEFKKPTIIKDGSNYRLFGDVGLIHELPPVSLEVQNSIYGLYLSEGQRIVLPEKIYSNDKFFIEHVLKTYRETEGSVGILLSGGKGLGKSFTANVLCKILNLPVIKITEKLPNGVDLFSFLNKIDQEHIIFIDEFEKIFSVDDYNSRNGNESKYMAQNDFLSFLDNGSIATKRLFIITANEHVSEYLMNRPTRIRYHRKYEKLEVPIIKEIVEDLLKYPEHKQDLIENIPQKDVNIDVLIKIIQEVNLHNQPYSNFKSFFNFQTGRREAVKITYQSGAMIEDELKIDLPLRIGQEVYYDKRHDNEAYLEEILSETNNEFVLKCSIYNDEHHLDETKPEYFYEVVILKRKYHLLF